MAPQYMGAARQDFERARGKARASRVLSFFTRGSDDLPTFEQIRDFVRPNGESYAGCKTIAVERIVGSEDRSQDFNKDFMPRREFMGHRWCSVASAFYEGKILPPIQVLELGGMYFIRDGNHRVSVARSKKVAYVDAEVTKLSSKVDFDSAASVMDLVRNGRGASDTDFAA